MKSEWSGLGPQPSVTGVLLRLWPWKDRHTGKMPPVDEGRLEWHSYKATDAKDCQQPTSSKEEATEDSLWREYGPTSDGRPPPW